MMGKRSRKNRRRKRAYKEQAAQPDIVATASSGTIGESFEKPPRKSFEDRYAGFQPMYSSRIKTQYYGYVDPKACEDRFAKWGMPLRQMTYTAQPPGKTRQKRQEFSDVKRDFIRHLATEKRDLLRQMGLKEKTIDWMADKARSPSGYNIHHKLPLGGGGQNTFENLIFIKDDPYHQEIHKHLDTQLIDIQRGETRHVTVAWPAGMVFIPGGPKKTQQPPAQPHDPGKQPSRKQQSRHGKNNNNGHGRR